MNARQVFAVVFRVFCQRPMPTNAVSGTATAKVNKRQRWRMADGESWAAAAPAFDLIERRLFGFKNVNQIHLIRPSSLPSSQPLSFLLSARPVPPLRPFTFVRQLQGTRHLAGRSAWPSASASA